VAADAREGLNLAKLGRSMLRPYTDAQELSLTTTSTNGADYLHTFAPPSASTQVL